MFAIAYTSPRPLLPLSCLSGDEDDAFDLLHRPIQALEAFPVFGKSFFVGVGYSSAHAGRDDYHSPAFAREVISHDQRDIHGYAHDVRVNPHVEVAGEPAAVLRQIDSTLLHAQDRVVVCGISIRCARHDACTLHFVLIAEYLLEQGLHHRRAAGITGAHAKNFSFHSYLLLVWFCVNSYHSIYY